MAKEIPSVLSFSRSCVISDGLFYSWLKEKNDPINLARVGWRGVQQENKKNNKDDVDIIGEADIAKLNPTSSNVVVNFTFRPLDFEFGISQVREEIGNGFKDDLTDFYDRAKNSTALDVLAHRIAINIANGRWLWRNRISAYDITVTVMIEEDTYTFNAYDYSLKADAFNYVSDDLTAVATAIALAWKGESKTPIKVSANVDMGVLGCEVYPSQAYINNPEKNYGRALYKLAGGQAAFRDAKIWNALRTIDTWYPNYVDTPIAVEPSGASQTLNIKTRKNTGSLKSFLKNLTKVNPVTNDGLFVTMCLIQGGVFSEK